MPMSRAFEERLFPHLPRIVRHFGTPFHIYDEHGIRETGEALRRAFGWCEGFREFFAVKALPNLAILRIMREMGFGFDCSSIPELVMARMVGAGPLDIMFTSNNTAQAEYAEAAQEGGCLLNLDDESFVSKVPDPFPEVACFRFNPGEERTGNVIIGKPVEAKYGLRRDQLIPAYRAAIDRGVRRFGIHTMVVSNERNAAFMVETVKMLLGVIEEVSAALNIWFEFMNIGGGLGIPYRPDDQPFDLSLLAGEAERLLSEFTDRHGYVLKIFMESGRYMTGPHGTLVTTVLNRMSKHREYVGVDACMSSLMRPAMYDAYHHITVLDRDGRPRQGSVVVVDVVGGLCENNDKFAQQRSLPSPSEGDYLLIHDTGAHGHAMGFTYNGRLRPAELLLCRDGSVELIRRAETVDDYLRTMRDFKPNILRD